MIATQALNVKSVSQATIRFAVCLAMLVGLSSAAHAEMSSEVFDGLSSSSSDNQLTTELRRSRKERRANRGQDRSTGGDDRTNSGSGSGSGSGAVSNPANIPAGQRAIVAAQEGRRGVDFLEVTDVEIVRILPADTRGSQHQKWVVQLANGRTVNVVYNVDICDEIPLKVGSRVSMGGQFIFDGGGGLIHWLHSDPRKNRKDGYVDLDGKRYGAVTHPDR